MAEYLYEISSQYMYLVARFLIFFTWSFTAQLTLLSSHLSGQLSYSLFSGWVSPLGSALLEYLSYVAKLGFELVTSGSSVRNATNFTVGSGWVCTIVQYIFSSWIYLEI